MEIPVLVSRSEVTLISRAVGKHFPVYYGFDILLLDAKPGGSLGTG
ncbi:MAG: hypothetical protein VX399_02445 [SAR324 cluster bacterium]|nr:hypothetical protein [SAR324 cluster bacterium]